MVSSSACRNFAFRSKLSSSSAIITMPSFLSRSSMSAYQIQKTHFFKSINQSFIYFSKRHSFRHLLLPSKSWFSRERDQIHHEQTHLQVSSSFNASGSFRFISFSTSSAVKSVDPSPPTVWATAMIR